MVTAENDPRLISNPEDVLVSFLSAHREAVKDIAVLDLLYESEHSAVFGYVAIRGVE